MRLGTFAVIAALGVLLLSPRAAFSQATQDGSLRSHGHRNANDGGSTLFPVSLAATALVSAPTGSFGALNANSISANSVSSLGGWVFVSSADLTGAQTTTFSNLQNSTNYRIEYRMMHQVTSRPFWISFDGSSTSDGLQIQKNNLVVFSSGAFQTNFPLLTNNSITLGASGSSNLNGPQTGFINFSHWGGGITGYGIDVSSATNGTYYTNYAFQSTTNTVSLSSVTLGVNSGGTTKNGDLYLFSQNTSLPVSSTSAVFVSTVYVTAALTGNGMAANPIGVNSSSVAVYGAGGTLTAASSMTAGAYYGYGGNLSGVSGVLSGGTANYVPKWLTATTQGASNIYTTASSETATGSGGFGVTYGVTAGSGTFNGPVQLASATLTIDGNQTGVLINANSNSGTAFGQMVTTQDSRAQWTAANSQGTAYICQETSAGGQCATGGLGGAAIYGSSGAKAVQIMTNGTPKITVLSGGNVGIGTASPATLLHMSSGTLTIDGNGTSQAGYQLRISSANGIVNFGITGSGHIVSSGVATGLPTLDPANSASGAYLVAGSNDTRGEVYTGGVNGSSATFTFAGVGGGFPAPGTGNNGFAAPICVCDDAGSAAAVRCSTTGLSGSATLFMQRSSATSTYLHYICIW